MPVYEGATWARAAQYNTDLPGPLALLAYAQDRWPGAKSLGIHADRLIRGSLSVPSVHSEGRAIDLLLPNRAMTEEAIEFLVRYADELGIQGVGDYSRPNPLGEPDAFDGWFWKNDRTEGDGWKRMKDSSTGWGQSWATWLHVEFTWVGALSSIPIAKRLPPDVRPPVATPSPVPPAQEFTVPTFPTLKPGATGWPVSIMQALLNLHLDGPDLGTDGSFGAKTQNHLTLFQATRNLTVDGICGPQTWAALFAPRTT